MRTFLAAVVNTSAMATVLPTWKLELIEKKRRREEDEKKRAEQEYARNTAIPEWKRSLLSRKKATTESSPPKNDPSNANSFVSQRKPSFSNVRNDGNADDRSEIAAPRSKRDVTYQASDEKSTIKGGGTSKITSRDSDQNRDATPDQVFEFSNAIENSGTDDLTSETQKVAYEHVRRPSVVRLMFENVAATKPEGKVAGDRQKHVSPTNSFREAKSSSPGASSDTSPTVVSTQDASEQSRSLKPDHRITSKSRADVQENSGGRLQGQEEPSLSPDTDKERSHTSSVKSLRDIFGGARQREKTASVDNLQKAFGQTSRPPPPSKRWSANVECLLSAAQSTEDLSLGPPPLSQRGRSMSLTDIREEHSEEHFKHKHNVASGLERRFNKLIRQVSLSEGEMVIENGESQSSEEESDISETSGAGAGDPHPRDEDKCEMSGPCMEQVPAAPEQSTLPGHARDASLNAKKVEQLEDSGMEATKNEAEKGERPSRGSVHKLSALFGASIWTGMKKDQNKAVPKGSHANHAVAEPQLEPSGKGTSTQAKSTKTEQPQGGLSISIPWLKNKAGQIADNEVPKDKVQSVSSSSDHSQPQQNLQKNSFNQKYKDTLERNKSADVTKTENANHGRTHSPTQHNVYNGNQGKSTGSKAVVVENAAVPVSAIDMPEPGKDDVSISVIDEPYSGVNVSIIDYPVMHNGLGNLDKPSDSSYLISDELSDDGSDEDMEGSYTVTSVDGEEEYDEDEDEIPVSCIDDSPPTIVVVFESAPEEVKSCIRPKNGMKKVRSCCVLWPLLSK